MPPALRHTAVARLACFVTLCVILVSAPPPPAQSADGPITVYLPFVYAPFRAPAWSIPDTIWPGTPSSGQIEPTVALDAQGNALAAWIEDQGDTWRVYAAERSAADPDGWSRPVLVHDGGHGQFLPVAAFDSTGRAYLAWVENDAPETPGAVSRIMLAERAPDGSWQTPEPITPADDLRYGCFDLVIDRQGGVHVLYNAADGPASASPTNLYYVTRPPAGTWLPREQVNDRPGALSYEYGPTGCPSLAVTPDGAVHAAWRDMRDEAPWAMFVAHIYYARRSDGVWSANELIDGFSSGEDHPSLAANADGNVYLAWADSRSDGANVRFIFRGRDGLWRPSVRVNAPGASGSEWGQGPSLGIDAVGNLYLIWPAGITTHVGGPNGGERYFFDWRPPVGDLNTAEAWGVDTLLRASNDLTGEQDFAVNGRGDFAAVWTEWPGLPDTPSIWSAASLR